MQICTERLVATFCDLVAIDAPSFGEREMADELTRRLAALGVTVSEDDAGAKIGGNAGNLYAYIPGTLPLPPLLFSAHMDCVQPACGKRAVVHPDGTITSDGTTVLAADDLTGVAAILEALASIADLPHRPLELLFSVAEEPYCAGSAVFDFSRIRSKEAYVLDLSGEVGGAALAAPSILSLRLTLHGRAAHAGFAPEAGIHAILAAAEALTKLPLGRIDPTTTVNLCTIHGGTVPNAIPETCVLEGEIRSACHETALRWADRVEAVFRESIESHGGTLDFRCDVRTHAYAVSESCPAAHRFRLAAEGVGIAPFYLETFGGSDNNTFSAHGISGLVIANAMQSIHTCREYTTVDELRRTAELTRALMLSQE